MKETDDSIIIELQNERPVDLLDLTGSLTALGEEFKRFTSSQGSAGGAAKLQIRSMRSGSIITELIPYLEQADLILKNKDILGGFMSHWFEILSAIGSRKPSAKELDKPQIKAARDFIHPVAKDGGAQINMSAQSGGTVFNHCTFNNIEASKIFRNAENLLGPPIPEEMRFENEPMILWQLRDGKGPGDKAIIDRFDSKPKKLTFSGAQVKDAILHNQYPFDEIYFVSGYAKTAGGKIAAYHIQMLEGTEPRDDE